MAKQELRKSDRVASLNLLDYVVLGENGEPVNRGMARTLNVTEAELWDDVKGGRRAIRRMQRGRRWEWQVAMLPLESQNGPSSPTVADT